MAPRRGRSSALESMMQNPRVFLWIGLALVLFMNYQAWLKDLASPAATAASVSSGQTGAPTTSARDLDRSVPSPASTTTPSGSDAQRSSTASANAPVATSSSVPAEDAPTVHVVTDVLDLRISPEG